MVKDSKKQKEIEELTNKLSKTAKIISNENAEKVKRLTELLIAKKEISFQNSEGKRRGTEWIDAKERLKCKLN